MADESLSPQEAEITARLLAAFLEGYKRDTVDTGEFIDFLYKCKKESDSLPDATEEQILKLIEYLETHYNMDSGIHSSPGRSEAYLDIAEKFYEEESARER